MPSDMRRLTFNQLDSDHSGHERSDRILANRKFSLSQNPNAIEFLKEHPEWICWVGLSMNPNAIDLLEANPDQIH